MNETETTVADIFVTLTKDQKTALHTIVGEILNEEGEVLT